MSNTKRIPPSLLQLSINTAINNLNHIRDVGDIDLTLLKEILNACSVDQLSRIEKASKRRDLSSVTDGFWNQFFIQRFGTRCARQELMMMKLNGASFNWKQLFYKKLKDMAKAEKKSKDKIKREKLIGELKKSFKQIKKAYKKFCKNAVFRDIRRMTRFVVVGIFKVVDATVFGPIVTIIVFAGVLLAAVATDLILGVIILALSPILIPIRAARYLIQLYR